MPTTPESIFSPCHCAVLRKASRHVSRVYDTALAPAGLKTTQFSLLRAINRSAGAKPSLNELSEVMVMDRSNLGHNLRPLERSGLVRLEKDPADARSRNVELTNRGRAKLEEATALWQDMQLRFENAFGKKSTGQLRVALLQLATTPL